MLTTRATTRPAIAATTPTKRPPARRHPILAGTPRGVFQPAAVGKVRGYPATKEAFDASLAAKRANLAAARATGATRAGIPTGYRGQREALATVRQAATQEGWKIAAAVQRDLVPAEAVLRLAIDPTSAASDDERAALGLAYLTASVLDPTMPRSLRLQAVRMLLTFVKPKPTVRVAVELDASIDWLKALVEAGRESA